MVITYLDYSIFLSFLSVYLYLFALRGQNKSNENGFEFVCGASEMNGSVCIVAFMSNCASRFTVQIPT